MSTLWHAVQRRVSLAVLCAAALAAGPASADMATITVSTNNTPLDRKVLLAVSQEAFRRVGAEFKLVSLPSERSLVAANLGEVDGEGLRVAGLSEQYANLVRVPERYSSVSFVAFARRGTISLEGGWEGLKPYSVAFINGWKMFEANATLARTVHKVDRAEQLFQMLVHERVDLALYTRADGIALARQLGHASVVPLSPALKDVDMFLYLHKKHVALVPRLAQALRDMKADGTYQRITAAISAD